MTKSELKSCPIKEVYKKFKHLDLLFSDKEWLKNDDEELGEVGVILPFKQTFYEIWQAIKEFNTRPDLPQDKKLKLMKETITSDDLRADEIYEIIKKCADQFGYMPIPQKEERK